MRKHIDLHYKSYDGFNLNEMDRKMVECFNEYGYNFESNKKRTMSLDSLASKSGPYCLHKSIPKEKG